MSDDGEMDDSTEYVNGQKELEPSKDKEEHIQDSDDELPSPSKISQEVVRATQTAREQAKPIPETIILSSDPPSPDVPTPIKTAGVSSRSYDRQRKLYDNPLEASSFDILAWKWSDLESEDNVEELNNAVLAKLILEMDSGARRDLFNYIMASSPTKATKDIQTACDLLPEQPEVYEDKSRTQSRAIALAVRLFLCWYNTRRFYWNCPVEECIKPQVRPRLWGDSVMRRWYNLVKGCLMKFGHSPKK
jgi:hypothetical protein